MTEIHRRGVLVQWKKQLQAAAVTCVYRRDGLTPTEMTFVPLQTSIEDYGTDVVGQTSKYRDWGILVANFNIDGQAILPERGDEIDTQVNAITTGTFRVLPPLGERCYRFTDQLELILRIHTIQVNTEN